MNKELIDCFIRRCDEIGNVSVQWNKYDGGAWENSQLWISILPYYGSFEYQAPVDVKGVNTESDLRTVLLAVFNSYLPESRAVDEWEHNKPYSFGRLQEYIDDSQNICARFKDILLATFD